MVASSLSGPLSQIPKIPRDVTPLHMLLLERYIPFQSYWGFEFQGDEPLPLHRFEIRLGVTIQYPPKEWVLDAFKLGGDINEDVRLNAYDEFMSEDQFVNTREFM